MPLFGSRGAASVTGFGGLAKLGYLLRNSLRFRSSASAYLNRTPASATNRTTWTYSYWFKGINTTGSVDYWALSAFSDGNNYTAIRHRNPSDIDVLSFNGGSAVSNVKTAALFRDPAAWYHMVIVFDTSNATQADRIQIYQNGVRSAVQSSPTYPGAGSPTGWVNSTAIHYIGTQSTEYFEGYMAEIHLIDGQALTPSSFGKTDPVTGQWIPKKFGGAYGTNGFYLNFTDASAVTAAALGKDSSGNGNNWTPNNFSITAGATYDSMTDVPTLTSATAANYCVINPLANSGIGTLSDGNLKLVTSTDAKAITGTMALPSTGQYYFEITATDYVTGGGTSFGVVNQEFLTGAPSNGTWLGISTYNASYQNGTTTDTNNLTGTDVTNDGDIWCFAIDVTNNKFWVGRSRSGTLVWADGVTPAVNGSGATTISLPTGTLYPMAYRGGSFNETYNFNFGQRPFAQTPPSGFKSLNTFNLP